MTNTHLLLNIDYGNYLGSVCCCFIYIANNHVYKVLLHGYSLGFLNVAVNINAQRRQQSDEYESCCLSTV